MHKRIDNANNFDYATNSIRVLEWCTARPRSLVNLPVYGDPLEILNKRLIHTFVSYSYYQKSLDKKAVEVKAYSNAKKSPNNLCCLEYSKHLRHRFG